MAAIETSKDILSGTGFSYISVAAAQLLAETGAQITGRYVLQVGFPDGTEYEQDTEDTDLYNFTLPCGCKLRYVAKSRYGVNANNRYHLLLRVTHFCASHDADGERHEDLKSYKVEA